MPFMNWTADFSVGIKEIDQQHMKLVDMLNKLFDGMQEKKGGDFIKGIVFEIVDYAAKHFALEEKYMKNFAFSGFAGHKIEHDKFVTKALDLKKRVTEGGFVLSLEVMNFLKTWLIDHIMKTDKAYSDCFKKNGVL